MSLRMHEGADSRRATSKVVHVLLAGVLFAGVTGFEAATGAETAQAADADFIDHGRYIARITGCNDCHTPGYADTGGEVPESQWLVGDSIGWRGPWGTTYPANLRLLMASITEEQWVALARTARYRPPMPWFALRDMTDRDLRALYRFIQSLGPAGEKAPDFVPPDRVPTGAFFQYPSAPEQK